MDKYIEQLLYSKNSKLTTHQQEIRDLVINSDDEDVPESQTEPLKEEKIVVPETTLKTSTSNMSMEDFIYNMASHDKVTNSDDEDEPVSQPEPLKEEKTEEMKKIEEREMRVKNAKIRFEKNIPKIVFIVPYRDRSQQRNFFAAHMLKILEDFPDTYYKIYYINQKDTRDFNRGAMKNIGFTILKNQYPSYYKNMTLVFNDVDVMPYNKDTLTYETSKGIVKHFYGFNYALGGIFSINAGDFEKSKGFPNIWDWGYEDIIFKTRVDKEKLTIDYSQFFKFKDGNIIKLNDDVTRLEQRIPTKYNIQRIDGYHTIYNLNYVINEETGIIEVNNFSLENSSTQPSITSTVNRRIGMIF